MLNSAGFWHGIGQGPLEDHQVFALSKTDNRRQEKQELGPMDSEPPARAGGGIVSGMLVAFLLGSECPR